MIPKKGQKFPFGFLLAEFRKEDSLLRLRYRIVRHPYSDYGIRIRESRSEYTSNSRVSENRVYIGSKISERCLFESLAKYIAEKEKVSAASIIFKWDNISSQAVFR